MPRRNSSLRHVPYQPGPSCQAKRRYASKSEAEDAAAYQSRLDPALELRAYRCLQCGGWHLTRSKMS